MASNTLSTKADICDAALALLRQDVGYSANTTVAAKCDNIWYVAWDALRNAHGWQTQMGNPTDTDANIAALPIMLRSLLVYAVARELAIPITGRQDDLKTVNALFAQKVREAAISDITAYAESQTDAFTKEVMLDCLTGIMKSAEAPVPHSTAAFSSLVTSLKTTAEQEVRKTLSVVAATVLDDLALAAVTELVLNRLSTALGLSEQYAQLHAQLYAARIAEWRKVKLNDALAANADPVLAQLLANFKSDDAGLVNAIEVYTNRFATIASASEREVRSQYDLWEDATNTTGTVDDEAFKFLAATYTLATNELTLEWAHSQHWFPAYEALVKAKLALVMGHDANAVAAFDAEYKAKLGLGLKIELDEKLNAYAVEATTGNRSAILYQLLPNFKADDPSLLHTFAVYDRRVVAVDEQSSATIRDLLGLAADVALTGSALEASIALSAAKLAPVVGLDASIVKVMTDRYLQIVEQAKKDTLDNIVTAADQTVEPFKSCMDEVKKTLGITASPVTDPLAIAAAKELTAANHGEAYGYDANYAAKRLAAYHQKILQWRKIELDTAMKANADPILAQLVANFKGDDEALVNAFATYTNRIDTVKDTVRDTILAKHHWSFARKTAAFAGTKPADCIRVADVLDASGKSVMWSVAGNAVSAATGATTIVYTATGDIATWPAVVRSAYVSAVAAEIAQTVVGNPETAVAIKAHLDKLAAKRLEEAIVADLNEDGSGSEIVREVKNVLKSEFHLGDADLDESATALAERISQNLDAARLEVLAAHNWNFARVTQHVAAYETPGHAFAFTRPTDALRISSVRTHDDCILGYTIDGTSVNCMEMPHTVTYVSDMPEPEDFPPLVRRALVYRLASDVAVSLPQRKGDPSVLLTLYKEKLASAATTDARESNPGRNAWGRGSYVSSMRGRFPRERAHYPFHR